MQDSPCIMPTRLPDMSSAAVQRVREVEAAAMALPQVRLETQHTFHAGLYGRTICIPASTMITGVEITIDTVLIVSGDCFIWHDAGWTRFTGYHVLQGKAGRKQLIVAVTDTWLTMLFASAAQSVDAAENEFTNEAHLLMSRKEF